MTTATPTVIDPSTPAVEAAYPLAHYEPVMPAELLKKQVAAIQDVMKAVMHKGEHYGVIPGCGVKPTLLQPGAQKLALTFGFAPSYRIDERNLDHGHREYQIVCVLTSRQNGEVIGEGVGCCSTMEKKYRYRSEATGRDVPGKYWQSRDSELLGGPRFIPRKVKGKWQIFEQVEYENPADYFNTALKMAKKRAFVDATLTACAASDIFTQDAEDQVREPEAVDDHPAAPAPNSARPEQRPADVAVIAKLGPLCDRWKKMNPGGTKDQWLAFVRSAIGAAPGVDLAKHLAKHPPDLGLVEDALRAEENEQDRVESALEGNPQTDADDGDAIDDDDIPF